MGRIQGRRVEALFPEEGPIHVLLLGEAPGPLGADQSGIPFWGDRAGQLVYRALEQAGMAEIPPATWEKWDGGRFATLGLRPSLHGAALGNAFPCCPTDNGQTFRAPKDRELRDPANLARLGANLAEAASRCPGLLRVIGLGRRAAWVLDHVENAPPYELVVLPHPSAQGLLQAAPEKGRGLKLHDLQDKWVEQLKALLRAKSTVLNKN